MRIKASVEPGRLALVTGGSSGIGLAVARLLAERGMDVWLLARRAELLQSALADLASLRQSPGQRFDALSVDVTDATQTAAAVAKIEKIGIPDLVINCAGVARPGYVQELELDVFRQMMEVNYFGTLHTVKAVLPGMLMRGSGYLVNIASLAGLVGVFGYTAYGASKFAVRGFSDALRAELKLHGIGVSLAYPADTDTPQLAYENQFKPPETKAVSGGSGLMTTEAFAKILLRGITRGQYMILPNFEGKLLYWLSGIFDLYQDQIVAGVHRKKALEQTERKR
ncbi:MAG TPA: SDR family oxidoreductase [Anaerolineales bacterium]|nr:SDR family oxidoreductase [Anaerolineales bacterium]